MSIVKDSFSASQPLSAAEEIKEKQRNSSRSCLPTVILLYNTVTSKRKKNPRQRFQSFFKCGEMKESE